ncbi:iron-containing redox enzyme family protein [Porticoccus sp. W117]|uniref:iron-containing redox enzyme family protein n=1 Tax=Porticoccus sp. W117 TaxID=3054777 RepID=UPI002595CCC6|nr:iron-containing redox enzyme family protein [Porticoccus sp. W117]MDM3871703.1 iron-containing redox enzyme family protein [Porticoccus sp. W117]
MEMKSSKTAAQAVMRQLIITWTDFESRLLKVPIIERIMRDQLQLEDYRQILLNHRQQVIEGSRWIARASSSIDNRYPELRSTFIRHANTEHRDYQMLDANYLSVGGDVETLANSEKNIGSEALSAWMFHQASQPNPFDLLGAMFIIEGLGKQFARTFAQKIQKQLRLSDDQVSFYLYHADHDEEHIGELEDALQSGILSDDGLAGRIAKTARVTARLYLLQLEELGNY